MNPTGNVTFLFTEIYENSGSSGKDPGSFQTTLDSLDKLFREIIESHNGFIFKRNNEAHCAAFYDPAEAVKAAVNIQIKLEERRIDFDSVKIKSGIHTGEAEYGGGDYTGYVTLSKVHRLMTASNGGQILISGEVYEDLKGKLTDKISYRDFGKRQLKDINQLVQIYQVVPEKIPSEFPPIKTVDQRWNNLPLELTSFIGRKNELKEIREILSEVRLLSIIGFGGTGKTRLAVHLASSLVDEFGYGVCIAELAKLTDSPHILQEIMAVLKIAPDVKREMTDVLADFLREKEILLILDNCEHLLKESAEISELLLTKCPKLKIIITSREPLHLTGENIVNLSQMELPDSYEKKSAEEILQTESVKLFIERAKAVKTDFKLNDKDTTAIAQLCIKLDGIPLAIELAAARVKVMPVEKILERLNDRFNLLTGGNKSLLPRQQTLKALIDWSYDYLPEKEKLLLQKFSVFSGGWTLEATEEICADDNIDEFEILDLLSNLSDKSLLKTTENEYGHRYYLLETIRKYGEGKLNESGNKNRYRKKHFDYFLKFAENSEKGLSGAGQKIWLQKIAAENENLRESLRWSLEYDPEAALKLSVILSKFWELRSYFSEGIESLQKALESASSADELWRARAIFRMGFLYIQQGNYDESKKHLDRCLAIFRKLKDKDGEAAALMAHSMIALFLIDYNELKNLAEESLKISEEINNRGYIARNLQNIALGLLQQGFHKEAREKIEDGISIYREIKDSVQLAKIIGNLGALDYLDGNYQKAKTVFEESLSLRRELGDRQGISIALSNLGSVAYMLKEYDEAERYLEESIVILKDIGDRRVYVTPISTLGSILIEKEDYSKAMRMFTEAINIAEELGDNYTIAKGFEGISDIFFRMKKFRDSCVIAGKYMPLLKSSQKNLIDAELKRIEDVKKDLRSHIEISEFEKLFSEGESMSLHEALEYAIGQNMKIDN
ncbi:MAG TPA: tetratricopeptide repeat protein [Ignavibacteria bacterium]|nr:tetratricopeptide repeat protein [Ignavibacteria bacterium]